MMPFQQFRFLFTDVDDTLTTEGKLLPETYTALWALARAGVRIIPVTGGCAGWCDQILRTWPVDAVIGEGGAFYVTRDAAGGSRWVHWDSAASAQADQQAILDAVTRLAREVRFPVSLAKDQAFRLADVAIDYNQDVRLDAAQSAQVSAWLQDQGFQVKQSSIHINVWQGVFDKCAMARRYLRDECQLDETSMQKRAFFVGDAPNDESMFAFFPHSAGVANIAPHLASMTARPTLLLEQAAGRGFHELAEQWLDALNTHPGELDASAAGSR